MNCNVTVHKTREYAVIVIIDNNKAGSVALHI